MGRYNTEQKKILLDFLQSNSENSYTIEEIVSKLAHKGIGKSTVYRLMTQLVEEKKIRKSAGEGRQFLYRITADEGCRHHLHLQCKDCGTVLHLDEETSHALLAGVNAARDFLVSEEDTVLMGRCSSCKAGSVK